MKLEEIALAHDFFVSRRLYPNVDLYTGLIYRAIGFGRLPGWIARWREMINDPDTTIGRPRQVYTGHGERTNVAMEER
jgi:citrate synthase